MRRSSFLLAVTFVGCTARDRVDTVGRAELAFKSAGALSVPRAAFGITKLESGEVLVIGGGDDDGNGTDLNERRDPVTGAWSKLKSMPDTRGYLTATAVPSGKVIVVGRSFLDSGAIYDPAINEWSALADDGDLTLHTATLLTTGKLLVVGARGSSLVQPRLYDPATNSWSSAGSIATPREDHVAATLYDGRVVIAGGYNGTYLSSVEIYAPATNSWSAGGSLAAPRSDAVFAELPDKRLLIAGGLSGGALSTAEIYDPVTRTSAITASMSRTRTSAAALVLPTGRVLVVGGDDGMGNTTATTEVYDPSTKKWSAGPAMATPRYNMGVASLGGGRFLIVGGTNNLTEQSSAEIFGGLAVGETCLIAEECTTGKCDAGKCAAPPPVDAGVDSAAPDAEVTVDATAPDSATGPVTGDFKSCTSASECASGNCVEGVCCDSPCNESCKSCALPWAPGKCTLEPYGTDKKNSCGSGACTNTCDGKGACVTAAAGAQCAPTRCVGPAKGAAAAVCTAAGATCDTAASATFDCGPYACEPALGACRATCGASEHCAPGFVCDVPSKSCVASPPSEDDRGCNIGARRRERGGELLLLGALALLIRRRDNCSSGARRSPR